MVDLIQTRSAFFSLKGDHRTFFEESLNKESVNKFSFRLILHRNVFFAQIYECADEVKILAYAENQKVEMNKNQEICKNVFERPFTSLIIMCDLISVLQSK